MVAVRWRRRRRRRIAVLFHEGQEPARAVFYAIHHLAEIWRADGLDVVYLFGVEEFVPADVVIVHVDLSVVPDEYLDFARRYPVAANGGLRDIRKSNYSTLRVARDSAYAGRVIVKSNYNYAGVPERVLGVSNGEPEFEAQTDYRVYDSVAAVPAPVFDDEGLVVERFVPEYEDGRYHVRTLDILGDRHTSLRSASDHHVVTDSTAEEFEPVEPPAELFEIRRRFGVDYGKLDYVVHDSVVTLLDVNKTVGASAAQAGEDLQARRRDRAEGIWAFLR
jgi:hypothetical protein